MRVFEGQEPNEISEQHWITSTKSQQISNDTLKTLIQQVLGKGLSVDQKQQLQTLFLKHSIFFKKNLVSAL